MRVSWFVPFRAGCQPYWLLPLPAALFGVRPLNADHHPILNGLATFPDNQRGEKYLVTFGSRNVQKVNTYMRLYVAL